MLSQLRHLLIDSWFGRIIVGLIFLVFISWGAETIIDTWSHQDINVVAWVGNERITGQQLDRAADAQMQEYAAQQNLSDKSQIPNMVKGSLVNQALQQLIVEGNLVQSAQKSGLTVSDDVLRNLIYTFPAFQRNGKFDNELYKLFLSQRNMPESQFIELIRNQLRISGLTEPLTSGAYVPDMMAQNFFAFRNETRQFNYVEIPFSQFKPNVMPTDAMLKRYYDNHLWEFTVPEFRKVKLIYITPQTVEKGLEVSDEQAQQFYNSRKSEFQKPVSFNLQIATLKDQKAAEAIAHSWSNSKWEDIQKQAQSNSGFAIALNDFSSQTSPSPDLSKAVTATPINTVSAPIKTPMGWSVFKVTSVTPAHEIAFDSAKDKIKSELKAAQAKQTFGANIKTIQDILAGGEGLDGKLGGLGVVGVEGTLNQQGLNLEGDAAPIPSDDKNKQAILLSIFSTAKNKQPSLTQGDNYMYYAFVVEDVIPAHEEAFDQAKGRVLSAWQIENIKRQANIAATTLFKQTQDQNKPIQSLGKTMFPIKLSESFSRINPSKTLPAELQNQGLMMAVGQTTMYVGSNGFYVASLSNIKQANPSDDPQAYYSLKKVLQQAISDDIYTSYVMSVNGKGQVKVNQQAVDALVKQISN